MHSLLLLHAVAAQRGDGLLPELVALLEETEAAQCASRARLILPFDTPTRPFPTDAAPGSDRLSSIVEGREAANNVVPLRA
jgi:hypothetical protein